ncbi:MAG TPA: spermidine/putrescine ABC transporter substrate-binding protein, partial [Limnochordia bacterium]|nr:spermidine/putrescine ABC transporter substrate-binding protein [Limnochordia bacterium]
EISFRNADYTGYAVTNGESRTMLPPEISGDRSIYPEPEDLVNSEVFVNLGQTLSIYDRIWTEVKAH